MRTLLALVVSCVLLSSPALAAGAVRISPVTLSVTAPAAATSLKLENTADRTTHVQVRVFAWVQVNGTERLEPSTRVVASPPIVRLDSGVDQTIRILRIDKTPVVGVENYRLLIDQVPEPADRENGKVAFVLRESIPVFFRATDATASRIKWSVKASGSAVILTATNGGQTAAKVANPVLEQGSARIALSTGLLGYVLGEGAMTWTIRQASAAPRSGQAALSYRSDTGVVNVPVMVDAGR